MVDAVNPVLDALSGPLPPQHGFPFDWAWEFQDGKRAFLSGPIAIVDKTDPIFVEWADDGRVPSSMPTDTEGNDSIVELQRVLDTYDLHATLQHYAGGLRYAKVQQPISIEVGGKSYRFQTDEASVGKLTSTVTLGEKYEALHGEGSFRTVWKTADGFTDGTLGLADLDTIGLAIGMNEAALFAKEDAAVERIASGAITTKEGVEAVFSAPVAALAKSTRKKTTS